jgi:alditol oxidase
MQRKSFIQLSSSAIAGIMLEPNLLLAQDKPLKNWAENLTYSTAKLYSADTVDKAQAFIKQHTRLKALGTRHCFNTIADSKDTFLAMLPMNNVIALDETKMTVTVGGGIKYGELAPYLQSKGYALHNLASLPHISVAGACTTATHGSGVKNGNLSTQVQAIEFIKANGEIVKLSKGKDGDHFLGAVVGLGALGIITQLTLAIQPAYMAEQQVFQNLPLAQLRDHFEEIALSGYSVSLFTDWQTEYINEVWVKNKVTDAKAPELIPVFFGAKAATQNLHPIVELSAENCTEQMGLPGPWYERLPHFRMGFTPSSGKELQAEFFIPKEHAVEAILAIQKMGKKIGPYLFISEIRTIEADDFWMSPCYHQPSIAIHFTFKQHIPEVMALLPLIEKTLAPFNAKPHWGKIFTMAPARLKALYSKMDDFKKLAKEFDPSGKFRNDFLNKNIFG